MARIQEWGNLLVLGRQRLLESEKLGYQWMDGYPGARRWLTINRHSAH